MSEEMKQTCKDLSLEEQVEMREFLSDLIEMRTQGGAKSPFRGSYLLQKMADVLGKPVIQTRSRFPEDVWARTMVAYQMIREGYSTLEISKQLLKDHSTVTHMKKKMQDALDLPYAYKDIMNIWNNFQKQIEL